MMNNYDRTLDLIIESQNSAGAAAQQYATYQDSIAAAQARLTASWENFYSKIVDNDLIKTAINGLSELVEALSNVPPAITAIGVTLGALKLQSFLTDKGGLVKILSGLLGGSGESIEKNGMELSKRLIINIQEGIDKYSTLGKGTKFFKDFKEIAKLEGISIAENLSSAFSKFGTILTSIPGKITNIAMALKGLMLTHPIITAITASVAALTLAIVAVNKIANKAKEDSKKSAEELSRLNEELDQTSSKLNNLENLITSYDKLNSKAEKTEEEQQELNNIIQQIGETSSIAKISVDSYGNSHLDNVDKIKQEIEILERYNELLESQTINERKKFLQNTKGMTSETATAAGETGLASALELKENFGKTDKDIKSLEKSYSEIKDIDSDLKILQLGSLFNNYDIPLGNMIETAANTYQSLSEQFDLGIENITKEQVEKAREAYVSALQNGIENFINRFKEINELIEQEKSNSFKDLLMTELRNDKNIDKNTLTFFDSFDLEITDYNEYLDIYQKINEWYQNIQKLSKEQQRKYEDLIKKYNAGEINIKELQEGLEGLENFVDSYVKNLIDLKIEKLENEEKLSKQETQDSLNKRREDIRNSTSSGANFNFISSNELDFYDNISSVLSENSKRRLLRDFGQGKNDSSIIESSQKLTKAAAEYSWETVLETIQSITNYLKKLGFSDQEINNVISGMIPDLQDKINQSMSQMIETSIPKADTYAGEITTEQYQSYADRLGGYENVGLEFNEEGKVVLDTFTQVDLILKDIEDRNAEIDNVINAVNTKLITQSDLSQEEKEILEKTIEVLKDQKIGFQDIINNTKTQIGLTRELNGEYKGVAKNAKALQFSADYAKEFKEVVDLAKEMQDQMDKLGQVDSNLMNQLLEMGPVFQEFFHVNDDDSVEMVLSEQLSQYQNAAEAITDIQRKRQETELEIKRQELEAEAQVADAKAELYKTTADIYLELSQAQTKEEFDNIKQRAEADINEKGTAVDNAEKAYNEIINAAEQAYTYLSQLDASFWAKLGKDEMKNFVADTISGFRVAEGSASDILTELEGIDFDKKGRERAKELEEQYRNAEKLQRNLAERLREAAKNLKVIDPVVFEDLKKKFDETGKEGADAMSKIADVVEGLIDAIEDLDKLLVNIKRDLKDISVDYNPFTDLFEAWEHEWDYYYNIKRLLQQIDTQGQYIDNIISADYVSADKRIEAEHAKVGNLLAKMAANDTYIEALRAGMSQTAVELMKDYGDYYKVDPETGQLYQTDKNLNDINELMNQRAEEIYNLQKFQNEKENDLALEEAKLDALEEEKSAYEDILSTIESQLDKLKDNEDIIVDISKLEDQKVDLEAKIEVTDKSIEDAKDKIQDLEDDIQEIEVDITLKDQDFQKLEDYVSDMEDKVSEYEEYWENLNSTIAEQQELLSDLNELYKGYVDTAISTQQELYDAIVENYQNEINQKKKQYDYLKQLDNDYLNSIKNNINKERQAREDANKQKSYQQNIQRAQLLQMDTSGAYRNELASLNKEIESQRQDLYDDLVDKQVEALEKEIEKRHELYDKEVAALEERLAYYQENAIILWEMVNSIVAEGAEAMMATLENTTAYINSNELTKDQQRTTWEYNVKKTFDGVQNHTIDTLNNLIKAGNDFVINKYPEIGTALDDYKQVFIEASDAVNEYSSQLLSSRDILNSDTERATQVFQGILDSFMITWNDRTNEFTGYAKNWVDITDSLKQQTEDNLSDLRDLYDKQGRAIEGAIGSIEDYNRSLRDASAEIYQDFLDERQNYRDELESLVSQIQSEISAAISDAADAIRNAADSISVNPGNDNSGNGDSGSGSGSGTTNPGTGSGSGSGGSWKWRAWVSYYDVQNNPHVDEVLGDYNSKQEALDAIEKMRKKWLTTWVGSSTAQVWSSYSKGGLADFTGPAWLDGTKSNPERVLSPKQTKLFESMVSSLERTANNSNINSPLNSSYNIGDINTTIQVEKLDNDTDIEKVARQVENRIMKTIRNRVSISVA